LNSSGKSDLVLLGDFCSIDSHFVLWPIGLVFGTFHGGGPMSIGESWPFRSPISKLLRFFWRSRDKWKAKCKEAKRENKSLKYRLGKMKESRDRWKVQARDLGKNPQVETIAVEEETIKNRAGRRPRSPRHRHA
jgi:hypothetical protein